jgi:cell wall-associated NlpC family hydrolase
MVLYTNTAAANLYTEAKFTSAIVSQTVLWEKLDIIDESASFYKVICEDGYQGWVAKNQTALLDMEESYRYKKIYEPFVRIYRRPDEKSSVIRIAAAGARVAVTDEADRWVRCFLPDGGDGWIKKESFGNIAPFSRNNLIDFAMRFRGVPYFWGGKTPFGFDCSGFTQFIHKIYDIEIRRDAYMQYDDARFVSDHYRDGKAGDLCFFSEDNNKITHVGFYLGNGKVLHARGMIRINSLSDEDAEFDSSLRSDFKALKTFLQLE